ncbi:unnamed protein product, partial [Effrenium voratum]
ETGILLYNALTGELEEELEDADISQIYNPKRVEFILNTLSRAIETRSVHLKRKLLADYEHLCCHNGEGMRSFINRHQRSERALLSVNIMWRCNVKCSLEQCSPSTRSRMPCFFSIPTVGLHHLFLNSVMELHFDGNLQQYHTGGSVPEDETNGNSPSTTSLNETSAYVLTDPNNQCAHRGGFYSDLALITIATAFLNKCPGFVLEDPPAGRRTTTSSSRPPPDAFANAATTSFDLLQGQVRLGERRRVAGNLKQAAQVLTVEQNVYGDLPSSMDNKSKIDVMEMFARAAEITHRAPSFGLKSLQPFDFEYGLDLGLEEHQQTWADAQRKFKPLVILTGIKCTKWIIMSENMSYLGRGRMDELQELRAAERPLVTFTTVHELMMHPEVYVVRGHAGANGGTTSTGELMKKTFQWVTNSKMLYYCKPLLGKELRQSAKYPDALVKSILQAVRVEAQRRCPQRFLKANEVYVAEPVEDPAAWAEVLRLAQRALVSDSTRGYNVPDDDKIYHIVKQLVPWDIVRVQISRCPVQRRLPRDISYTHRGAVLQYQDGGIEVEHEALDGLHFPKQRFRKAVACGVFWYDVFYCRDVMGVNYAVVGIVDQPTLSQTMVDAFQALWLRPYGFPLEVRVDPAGPLEDALEGAVHAINSIFLAFLVDSWKRPQRTNVEPLPGAMRPDVLRAEAVKAIAEINVSQDLQIEPGQNCAYWRWQIQVDQEDIAAIKDGATSIQKDLWEDHRADGPPRDEDEYDYDLEDPAERMPTRKEAKALNREIPWRQILSMPKEKIQAFIDSAIKEENGWKTWGSVEPVHEAEAKAIMTDPKRRRRVLKSRACYHNKSRDPSKPIAKTRVVALDLYKINRDAPTPSRTSEYLLLSIYAAGVNGVFQNEALGSSGQETSAPRSCRGFAKTETNRLANKGKETATADLATLYSAIGCAKETSKQGLVFQDVPINKATVVWANAVNCSSQQGVLTLLTTPHCSQVTAKANLVDWKSNRSARVCRSTLAAEAMACDDSVDRAYFTNIILYELLHAEK